MLNEFDKLWRKHKVNQSETVFDNRKIPFCGGWFLYLGYEIANEIEEKINIPSSPYLLPDAFVARVHSSITFDHISKRIFLITDKTDHNDDVYEMLNDVNNFKF